MKKYIQPKNVIVEVDIEKLIALSQNDTTPLVDDEENNFVKEEINTWESLWDKVW